VFLHTRGLAKSANSYCKSNDINRLVFVNSIRIFKNFAWHHCRLDVINFSIQSGLIRKLAAATNENKALSLSQGGAKTFHTRPFRAPHPWGSLGSAPLLRLIGRGGQFSVKTALDYILV